MQELAGLRRANRDLLGRLRAQQEEIRRRLPRGAAGPAPPGGKENQGPVTEATSHPGRLVSVEPSRGAARAALCSPLTPTERGRGASRHRASTQKAAALEGGSLGAERSSTPAAAVTRCARGASRAARDSRSPDGESLLPGHRESSERFVTLRSPREKGRVGTKLEPVLNQTQAEENGKHPVLVREPRRPKSILLMPQRREAKKEAGHVTFQDNLEEYTIPAESWSVRPLLGYDWIAGLLETDSSVSEKSEQYFAELKEFRLVNKEACVYEQCLEPESLGYLAPEQDADLVPTSHQCVYCYRLNKRLFPVPVDWASACPICKTPRAQRPPETLEEPAYIRVSIPRTTLLPAHKYKIHRRKSFEAADNLALPSHCLVGWENVIPFGSPTMSSLDLRTSLEEKPTDPFPSGDQLFHWNSWQPWVCMCEQYKQARIRYFVVWAENITVKPKASEFWQEKPCSLRDCSMCKPEECPGGPKIPDFLPQLEHLSVSGFSNTDSPPLGTPDFKSYDSLPVVDDIGEE